MSDARDQAGSDAQPATADLSARLTAVERALTDSETAIVDLEDAAELTARLDRVDETVEDLESRVAELEAATQALRGFLGGVRAVNRDVERRANTALAKVESLEQESAADGLHVERLDELDISDRFEAPDGTEDGEGGTSPGCNDTGGRTDGGLESLAARIRDAL